MDSVPSSSTGAIRKQVRQEADRYVSWLTEACSIPSMAIQPEGLAEMANWLEGKFVELDAPTERLSYADAPDALLAQLGSGERTVLIYDHYDVQPVDPLDLWQSQPFSPEIRDGVFYARGAADNKGDLVARLAGLDAYRRLHGEPRVHVKFLVEGEEEVGSKNFSELINKHGDRFSADGCIWEGQGIDHYGRPSFVFGAKGLCYVELTLDLLRDDQHSSIAVIAPNAGWRLMEALATLRDPNGRVTIDGFYDDVVEPGPQDLEVLKRLPFDEEAEKKRLGVESFVGNDTGIALLRRYYFEPTCNLAGFATGFIVPNTSKTVLPREAMAKLDMRLVPKQDPNDIAAKLRRHLDVRGFEDIEMKTFSMQYPVQSPTDSLIGRAAIDASKLVFEQPPTVAPMMIGTGPMYPVAATLGLPTVSPAGVCRPDSNIHAPNENCRIEDFLKVVEYTVAWLERLEQSD